MLFQRWPADHKVHVWMPSEGWRTESNCGGQPPGAEVFNREGSGDRANNSGGHVTKSSNPILKKGISPLVHVTYASCTQQQSDTEAAAVGELTSLASNIQGHPHWSHRTFNVIGFGLSLNTTLPDNTQPLSLSLWPSSITKGSFMKYG